MNELEYYQVRHGVRTFTDFVYKRKDIECRQYKSRVKTLCIFLIVVKFSISLRKTLISIEMQYFGNTVCSKKFMCNVRKCVNIRRNARIQMNVRS